MVYWVCCEAGVVVSCVPDPFSSLESRARANYILMEGNTASVSVAEVFAMVSAFDLGGGRMSLYLPPEAGVLLEVVEDV
jgi:hypothetical protein